MMKYLLMTSQFLVLIMACAAQTSIPDYVGPLRSKLVYASLAGTNTYLEGKEDPAFQYKFTTNGETRKCYVEGKKGWSLNDNFLHLVNQNTSVFIADKQLVLIDNVTLVQTYLPGTENTTNISASRERNSFLYVQNGELFRFNLDTKKYTALADLKPFLEAHKKWYEDGLPNYSGLTSQDDKDPSVYDIPFETMQIVFDETSGVVFGQYRYRLLSYDTKNSIFKFVANANQSIQLVENGNKELLIFANDEDGIVIYDYLLNKIQKKINLGDFQTFKYLAPDLIIFSPSSQNLQGAWGYGGMMLWDGKSTYWFDKKNTPNDVILLDK